MKLYYINFTVHVGEKKNKKKKKTQKWMGLCKIIQMLNACAMLITTEAGKIREQPSHGKPDNMFSRLPNKKH